MRLVAGPASKCFAAIAVLTIGGFGLVIGIETAVAAASDRAEGMLTQIALETHALESSASIARTARAVESRISRLHLDTTARAQSVILIGSIERAAAANGLRIIGVRRASAGMTAAGGGNVPFERDPYQIVIEGAYPRILNSVAGLSRTPLVMQVALVTFERVHQGRNATGDVRASLELGVYRFKNADVPAH